MAYVNRDLQAQVNCTKVLPELDKTGGYLPVGLGAGETELRLTTPPEIESVASERSGNVLQLSLINEENVEANPDHNIRAFTYTWTYQDKAVEGTAVRLLLTEPGRHELKIQVAGLEADAELINEFDFIIVKPEEEK